MTAALINAGLIIAGMASTSVARAQRAPMVGGVSPSAIGPAVPQPAPIGGLRGAPLTGRTPGTGETLRGWTPVRVIDAPIPPAGIVAGELSVTSTRPQWMPTYEKPTWTRDTTAEPSSLWRDLMVRDVVCNFAGSCVPRQSRVRARWVARCDCYAFADGLGRVWMVERR